MPWRVTVCLLAVTGEGIKLCRSESRLVSCGNIAGGGDRSVGRLYQAFITFFLLRLAQVLRVLRQNSLIMTITKAGKQLHKFATQFILNIFFIE